MLNKKHGDGKWNGKIVISAHTKRSFLSDSEKKKEMKSFTFFGKWINAGNNIEAQNKYLIFFFPSFSQSIFLLSPRTPLNGTSPPMCWFCAVSIINSLTRCHFWSGMQLCKAPSTVDGGIFATRRRATSFGSENASLDQKMEMLDWIISTRPQFPSRLAFATLEARNMANFLFLLAPKILFLTFSKSLSFFCALNVPLCLFACWAFHRSNSTDTSVRWRK